MSRRETRRKPRGKAQRGEARATEDRRALAELDQLGESERSPDEMLRLVLAAWLSFLHDQAARLRAQAETLNLETITGAHFLEETAAESEILALRLRAAATAYENRTSELASLDVH